MSDETRKRAQRKGLSEVRIFATALAVIDEEGLPALNMRRLGAAMGVDAMALYRHLPNKQAVLDGVVDLVLAGVEDDAGEDVRERTHRFFSSLREALASHPNAIPLVASSAARAGATREPAARLLAAMQRAGLGEEQALDAFHTLESFTLGYAWLELAGFVGELPESAPFVRSHVPRVPAVGTTGVTPPLSETDSRHERFDRCLQTLLGAFLLV